MMLYFWIALGSALGGMGRFALSSLVAQALGESFPWGTLVVNVLGAFGIGLFATLAIESGHVLAGPTARHFMMTGIFGGFTTFSSFSLQTFALLRAGEWLRAGGNVVGSVALCMLAVWLGHLAAVALGAAVRGA